MTERLFVWLQWVLPRFWLTRIVYRIARIRSRRTKNFLITRFVAAFGVDTSDCGRPVPGGYRSFNDFFTRELRNGARDVDESAASIASPVDGTVSALGPINGRQVFQAKGKDYSLDDLLSIDLSDADSLAGGSFATIYLAPYNYHRVHAPIAGRLTSLRYIPGDLFSVNAATVKQLPRLFARNERLVCRFESALGPHFVILVGALNVGSMTTPWTGEIRPSRRGMAQVYDVNDKDGIDVSKGELLGWFNMGSTVIMLFPPGAANWRQEIGPGETLRMGEPVGSVIRPT